MKSAKLKVINRSGLHARPAAMFVQTTRRFSSKIVLKKDEKIADAKNILQVLALGVDMGDEVEVVVEGPDEDLAIEELKKLLTEVLPAVDK